MHIHLYNLQFSKLDFDPDLSFIVINTRKYVGVMHELLLCHALFCPYLCYNLFSVSGVYLCVLMFHLLNNTVYCLDYIVCTCVYVCRGKCPWVCVWGKERERRVAEVLFNSAGSFWDTYHWRWMNEVWLWSTVECYCQGKTIVLGEKSALVSPCDPQIPHALVKWLM
jgi:hypothetical protein